MKIQKCREVKTPTRAYIGDAGIDFYVPVFKEDFVIDLCKKNNIDIDIKDLDTNVAYDGKIFLYDAVILKPNERILIPSGIKIKLDNNNTYLRLANKSGVSTKKGLDVLAGVIDFSYCGEIHISLVNTSNKNVAIQQNEKIIQGIITPCIYESIDVVDNIDIEGDRGEKAFGSTDSLDI